MVRSAKFPSPLSERWPPPQTSSRKQRKNTRHARRSASPTQLRRPIGLKNAEKEREVVSPISVIVTEPERDDLAFGSGLGVSGLVPRGLHARPSSPVLGQYRLSTSSHTTRSLDDLTRRPSTNMSRDSHSPSALKAYYGPETAPLSISQQTSASSSRDFSLRKTDHGVAEVRELGPVPPRPSAASFHLPEEAVLSRSKFYKKRPPQLDLSLLFPKPQPSTGGLLSPDKLVHSPQQLSPVSDTSSRGGAADSMWQICNPLRKTLSKESLRSRDYSIEISQCPKPNSRKESSKVDLQNLQNLLKRKVSTDVRSEIEEADFVQRLAQNIQDRCPKVPKPLDNCEDLFHQGQDRRRGGTTRKSIQRQAISTPEPPSNSVGRGSPGSLRQKAAVPNKAGTTERYVLRQPRNEPLPRLTGRKRDPFRPSSSNSSGRNTTLSKRSGGGVFSKLDLQKQSVLELSSSGDEGEVFGNRLGGEGEETEDDFIFQGRFERSPLRSTESCSSRSSYVTANAEQRSKGSRKSNMMSVPNPICRYVPFLRPEEPRASASRSRKPNPESTRFCSWLTEITPPASPEPPSNTGSMITTAASRERGFLQTMREKRAILGRLATDILPENLQDGRMSITSYESSIWLPLERNSSPQRSGQRLSGSKSSPSLRTEHGVDRSSTPLRSPSESSRWIRRTPSFVRTSSLPSPPSSEPSPITPPAYHAMPGQMINCLLSASTSPSSTLCMHKYLPTAGSKVTDGTFLDPATPASPLLDRSWRTPSTERSISRLISASTSTSSIKGNRGKKFRGRKASFDRLVPEGEEKDFCTSEGFAYSDLDWKA
ncbi:MAG: hypothetical protein M1840_003308 [Geoglossum simile]|nr:MAG: hypothetical protein M1840_003308 [Geoglossum simile]